MAESTAAEAAMSARSRRAQLQERYDDVRAEIDKARASAGRQDEIRLVVVTKFHPFSDQVHLAQIGAPDLGENRVQEAQAKALAWQNLADDGSGTEDVLLAGEDAPERPRLHMIGHIQSKKTGAVARWADEVHSVDSIKVAEGLSRGRVREIEESDATTLRCLVQLSLDGEEGRGGAFGDEFHRVCDRIAELPGLELGGLMVVPPLEGEPARHFEDAAMVREKLRTRHSAAKEFSAGMSGDLESAIFAGSTCVRVGTSILGPRPIL